MACTDTVTCSQYVKQQWRRWQKGIFYDAVKNAFSYDETGTKVFFKKAVNDQIDTNVFFKEAFSISNSNNEIGTKVFFKEAVNVSMMKLANRYFLKRHCWKVPS